ncbi:MAG: hypothetical protein KF760_09675 [Candidatus Eremiobacteraeota bacterium]|nr:hypothetical protein [Candidatus Eremiobacteraeota bacterium]MCW5866299.1 hypothetical protein [Candidatus Eremiobacteraeota bacterium]
MRQYPRLGGLVLTAIGAFLAKLTIYDVWQQARAGSPSLSLHMKGVVLSIATILGGLAMVAAGPAVESPRFRNPETRQLTPTGFLILLIILAPAFAFHWWFEHKLIKMGYQF